MISTTRKLNTANPPYTNVQGITNEAQEAKDCNNVAHTESVAGLS